MNLFDILIEFKDGTEELVKNCDEYYLKDGILTILVHGDFSLQPKHLGSWPLVNIKKYKSYDIYDEDSPRNKESRL